MLVFWVPSLCTVVEAWSFGLSLGVLLLSTCIAGFWVCLVLTLVLTLEGQCQAGPRLELVDWPATAFTPACKVQG